MTTVMATLVIDVHLSRAKHTSLWDRNCFLISSCITNGSRKPTSGSGLDCTNGSAWCHTHPNTRPANTWWSKLRPVPFNPRVALALCRPIGANLWFCVSGFTFVVTFRCPTMNHKIWTLVGNGLISMYWLPWWLIAINIHAPTHPENKHQRSVNCCWVCILSNLECDRLHVFRNKVLAAFIAKRESETLRTISSN